ncbi:MAG: hypothetical protein M0C28_20800 [Candidatus Moduliflexus flocculans]|nr:hypothetical protein [Candidatus Moduliflexus flocculans]
MRKALLILAVLILAALPAIPVTQNDSGLEADIRAAMANPSNVMVIIDTQDSWAVFPVSGISEVAGTSIIVKEGTFVIADCQGAGSAKKQAGQLLAKWKSRQGDNVIVVSGGGMQMLTFFFGELKEARTFEVKKIMLPAPPKR